jgi:hypothetical protein
MQGLTMARRLLLIVALAGCTGCLDANYKLTELYGLNCRPEMVRAVGSCVTTKAVPPAMTQEARQ